MYHVEWRERALEDLLTKVKTERVATALRRIADVALDHYEDDDVDGGVIPGHGTILWRRGITIEQRAAFDAAETRQLDRDNPLKEEARDYCFIYHRQGSGGYLIVALFTNGELNEALNNTDIV